ncbi:hypothetical protein RUA4292_04042 [Ruegeria atlantica]|uniref:Uncharacterized protein n=1 Tax=Ruegeria atlantica TaxID=81569 RepID=A0A0P1EIG4_9RHOB|nr:hypothetical protein RUA4292_04042 [Ruegeria atlantica]
MSLPVIASILLPKTHGEKAQASALTQTGGENKTLEEF